MKIKIVTNRLKLENGIGWEKEKVVGICHRFRKEEKEIGCSGCKEPKDQRLVEHKVNIRLSNTR